MQKTEIKRGARALVHRGDKVREAKVMDAQGSCVKLRFRWLCFWWTEWVPVKGNGFWVELPKDGGFGDE